MTRRPSYVVATALLTLALAASSPAAAQAPAEQAVVTEVGVPTIVNGKRQVVRKGGLGERLAVRVTGLKDPSLLSKAVLHIDGLRIDGLPAVVDYTESSAQFDLAYTTMNKAGWIALFHKGWARPVAVTVSVEDGRPLPRADTVAFELVLIRTELSLICLGIFVALFALFAFFAIKSDLLRDIGPQPAAVNGVVVRKPYSLGRCQMAWWLFIVLASYLFLGTVTGNWDSTISAAAMGLIGISAATAVGAVSIDTSKRSGAEAKKRALETEQTTLQTRQAALGAAPDPTIATRLGQIAEELRLADAALDGSRTRGNIVSDILSDANGIALHRFQIVAWTTVLGFVFLYGVYTSFVMPQFSGELLALLGISGGTYLGFKYPERPA